MGHHLGHPWSPSGFSSWGPCGHRAVGTDMGHLCPNLIPGPGFMWSGHSTALDLQLLVGCLLGVVGAPPPAPGVSLCPLPYPHWVGAVPGGSAVQPPQGLRGAALRGEGGLPEGPCSTGGPGQSELGERSRLLGGAGARREGLMRPGVLVRPEGPGSLGGSAHPERARCVLWGRCIPGAVGAFRGGWRPVAPWPPPVLRCRRCPLRSPSP